MPDKLSFPVPEMTMPTMTKPSVSTALVERLQRCLRVEQGLAESLRQALDLLLRACAAGEVLLVFREEELDRLFVWRRRAGDSAHLAPESLPITSADSCFAESLTATVCWNSLEVPGKGFAWNRATGEPLSIVPRPVLAAEQGWKRIVAVTFDFANQPAGRVLILNARRPFSPADVRRLERVVSQIAPALENLVLLRHIRARAIESERSRISRDLHDGILQTLWSLNIRLDVARRKLAQSPAESAEELASLHQILQQESEQLRQMVTDMRPMRIESADLVELMQGFTERFRNESRVAVDLILEAANLQVPDRVARELFQIYREALHNIKKHAQASHVVVKLWQDEAKVSLVVDDNGQGFSFGGRFTSDELDRLRLGPISIKERTRSVGGVLTVESSPGHGARLTVEIPLS